MLTSLRLIQIIEHLSLFYDATKIKRLTYPEKEKKKEDCNSFLNFENLAFFNVEMMIGSPTFHVSNP